MKRTPVLIVLFIGLLMTGAVKAATTVTPDFRDIYIYALLSDAAYRPQAEISKILSQSDFELDAHDELPGYGVSYYLATSEARKQQIVVVRGTSNVENAMVDAAIQFVDDEHTGVRLHQGFARAASYLYERLQPRLQRDYRIDTTGHSLGGAVALVLAMHLDADDYKLDKVVTFGQPKVSDVSGSRRYAHLDVTRVVTPKDMVPLVPPVDPMSVMTSLRLDIYWHQGTELLLLDGDRYALLEGMDSILRATDMMVEIPSEKNLQHHMITTYLAGIRSKLTGAQRVEHKSKSMLEIFGVGR